MQKITKYLLFLGLFIGFVGCGSSTGPDHGDPPSLPQLQSQQAKPDLSYFEQNQPKRGGAQDAETTNYYIARTAALSFSGMFSEGNLYTGFLSPASQQDATYNDGVWEWKYSYNFEGQSIEIRLTAESITGGYQWAMYWSYNGGSGMSFDNYKVLEGTTSSDGSEGTWTFNALDPTTNDSRPALKNEWTVTSETQKTMTIKVYDDAGNLSLTIDFKLDGTSNTLTFNSLDTSNGSTTVFWDTDTQTGYVIQDGTKSCWDSNFANTPCS